MLNDYKIAILLRRIAQELEAYAAPEDLPRREESKPDFVEVGRTAYELGRRHGQNACQYAARLAAEAIADGKIDEAAFWKAVAEHLQPREFSLLGTARVDPRGFSPHTEGQHKDPDYVRKWCRILIRYAEMFESDRCELTRQRREEIHRIIFGGMGSFSDFNLNSRVLGDGAEEANGRLQALRNELYSVFTV